MEFGRKEVGRQEARIPGIQGENQRSQTYAASGLSSVGFGAGRGPGRWEGPMGEHLHSLPPACTWSLLSGGIS